MIRDGKGQHWIGGRRGIVVLIDGNCVMREQAPVVVAGGEGESPNTWVFIVPCLPTTLNRAIIMLGRVNLTH